LNPGIEKYFLLLLILKNILECQVQNPNNIMVSTTEEPTEVPVAENSKAVVESEDQPPAKRQRKSYTDNERRLMIWSNAVGGRKTYLRVAEIIGMPESTADKLISRVREEGPEDASKDHRLDKEHHRMKRQPWHEEFIRGCLSIDPTLTQHHLQDVLNHETLRRLLAAENIERPETLDGNVIDHDHTVDILEKYPSVKEAYSELHIRSPSSVLHWVEGIFGSKKFLHGMHAPIVESTKP